MHPPRRNLLFVGVATALLELAACAGYAQELTPALATPVALQTVTRCESCARRVLDFSAPTVNPRSTLLATADRTGDPLPHPQRAESEAVPPPDPFVRLHFRDQEPLVNRLRRLQAVPLVTLWDSREATVYVGVDRRGKAGLHLRQKVDDRGTRATQTLTAPEDDRPKPRPPKSRAR